MNSRAATLFYNYKGSVSNILDRVTMVPKQGLLSSLLCCFKPASKSKKKKDEKKEPNSHEETKTEEKRNLVATKTIKIKDEHGDEYEVQIEEENSQVLSAPAETNEVSREEPEEVAQDLLEDAELSRINSGNPNPNQCFVYRLNHKFVEMKGIAKQFMKKDEAS